MKHEERIWRLMNFASAPRADAMQWRYKNEGTTGYYPTLRGRIAGIGNRFDTRKEAIAVVQTFRQQCRAKLVELGYAENSWNAPEYQVSQHHAQKRDWYADNHQTHLSPNAQAHLPL